MTNKLFPIAPQVLSNVINVVYPRIEAATVHSDGKYKGSDILQQIIAGNMQLWAAVDETTQDLNGIGITEIAVFPQRKVCRFLAATGENAADWILLIAEIEEWAKSCGCKSFEPVCRPGWEKALKPLGYKKTHVVLSKELQ